MAGNFTGFDKIDAGTSGEPKKILERAYNTLDTFNKGFQQTARTLVYGNPTVTNTVTLSDFRNNAERQQLVVAVKNIGQNPSLYNINNTLEVVNTYDLCNPLQFALTQLFPPGSEVANILGEAQEFIDQIVGTFRGSSLIEGTFEVEASTIYDALSDEVESIPFTKGNIVLGTITPDGSTPRKDRITNGTYVTITQTDDPKVTSVMRGSVINSGDNVDENTGVILGSQYVISIESIEPSTPPYQRVNGNVVTDDTGEPILATYQNFKISGEKQLTSDVKEIGSDLVDISNDLRSLDFATLRSIVNRLPNSFKGIKKFKKAINDIAEEIQEINQRTAEPTDAITRAGGLLSGQLTVEEAIAKSRKLREAYRTILPFTNIKFAVQEKFKKEIENINRFLRDFIPLEELGILMNTISHVIRVVVTMIDFLLALLIFINTIIKMVVIVLKVIRVIAKVLGIFLKAFPIFPFAPAILVAAPTDGKSKLEVGISRAIDLLIKISNEFNITIGLLGFIREYLASIAKETAILGAKLQSCDNLNSIDPTLEEKILEAAKNSYFAYIALIEGIPGLDKFQAGQFGQSVVNKTGATTFVRLENGNLLVFPDSVFGYDEFGNILFYGDLTSLATGVSFENTLGQEFRSRLNYYTFNKFEAAKHGPLVQSADNLYLEQGIADPEDAFGNFQEIYLGYTLKIQEDKPVDKNKTDLLRRRGVALDSNNNLIVATDLTFSTDLASIINELKYKLRVRLDQGIIGINTLDKESNQINDSDAIDLAGDLGANPLILNNLKAASNDRSLSNISAGKGGNTIEGRPVDPNDPVETRIGGAPFIQDQSMGGGDISGASSISDKESPNMIIDTSAILSEIINEQQNSDPKIQAIKDVFRTLNTVDSSTLSNLMKSPDAQNLSDTELFNKLTEQVLSSMDPNPVKVDEVKKKTEQWYEGLRASTRIEWEQLTLNYRPPQRPVPPPYEDYFTSVEKEALPQWIKKLLRSGYTEMEVQMGIEDPDIRDKYTIKIGPKPSEVKVKLRSLFRRKN